MGEIDNRGKGLIGPHPKDDDPRRFQLSGLPTFEVAGSMAQVFDSPAFLPEPPDEDQGSSLSCTWQAFAYAFWQWTGIQLSRQDGYSRTHLPQGGGYLIDPFRMMLDGKGEGAFDRSQHADPKNQTEQNMIIKVMLPGQVRKVFKLRYWYVPYNDVYAVGAAIKAWKGVVIGVYGNNPDWTDGEHPKVPKPGTQTWAHALYCYDVGWDKGQEAVIAKSSWCNWVKKHYIIKDYFTTSNVFSPIVMEVKEVNIMDETLIINYKGAFGFLRISDGRVLGGALAANPTEARILEGVFEKNLVNDDDSFMPADITYGV